jgi:hypothetical protein
MTDDQKSSVKEQLVERGFALELETYLALRKRGWFATMQGFFTNVEPQRQDKSFLELIRDTWNAPPEPKYRTIDIQAMRSVPSKDSRINSGFLGLTIECKRRKGENWVFYTESKEENQSLHLIQEGMKFAGVADSDSLLGLISFGEISSFGDSTTQVSKELAKRKIVWTLRGTSHHAVRNLPKFALSHRTVFGPANIDNVTDACRQVLGACFSVGKSKPDAVSKMLDKGKPVAFWRLYPVVVFSGDIWEARFDEHHELILNQIGWITYLYPHKGKLVSVDIVSFDSLNEYLDVIDNEFTLLENALSGGGH